MNIIQNKIQSCHSKKEIDVKNRIYEIHHAIKHVNKSCKNAEYTPFECNAAWKKIYTLSKELKDDLEIIESSKYCFDEIV
jgi:hypothetical protein